MRKVAILTKYYNNYNYGGMLQGYALCSVIRKLGHTCDIVSYDPANNGNPVYPNKLAQAKQYGFTDFVSKFSERLIAKCNFRIRPLLDLRRNRFRLFMDEVAMSTKVYDDSNMNLLNSEYDAFVSGSDQIWNPNAVRNLYLQTFVDNHNLKIAYAASIGRKSFSEQESEIMIPWIKRFDYLGIREKTGTELLSKYMDKKIETVIDPTMLLSSEEWSSLASERLTEKPYAVCYFFSDSSFVREYAAKYCKINNLELLFIPYAKQEYNLYDGKGSGKRLDDIGPKEFVSAIRNAEIVFTDSFHGAVFSIINRKSFFVFERNKEGHVSMNSRLYDLLDGFDLSDRLVSIENIERINSSETIDYDKVHIKLEAKKQQSLAYLKNALNDNEKI
ncbi:MAG: polysaccharide pyruvyl transferase family protein [Clostridia bacterium]|nr:polysaccharide pyruvyl transferase family protein [Clostridia bacterium]